jgi:hypothetical protein
MPTSKLHLFELRFLLSDGMALTALIEADDANEAVRSIMNVWGPPSEISAIEVIPKEYFQVYIPSLTGYLKQLDTPTTS